MARKKRTLLTAVSPRYTTKAIQIWAFLQRQRKRITDIIAGRYFTDLDSDGAMYYKIPTVTLTGDYKVTALVYFTGSGMKIVGQDASFNGQLSLTFAGAVNWKPANSATTVTSADGVVPLNALSIISVDRSGSIGVIEINAAEVFNGAVPTGILSLDTMAKSSAAFSNGILANVNINDQALYELKENFGTTTVVKNSLAVLGPELVTNTPVVADDQSSAIVSYSTGGNVTSGVTYLCSATVAGYSGTSTVGFLSTLGIASSKGRRSSNGPIEFEFTADSTGVVSVFNRSSNECTFNDISIKQADGYGTAINISESDYFTEDGVDYLGVEKVTQAAWENPNNAGSDWAFASNQWTLTGLGGASILKLLSTAMQPNVMRLAGNVVSISADLKVSADGGNIVSATGPYSFDLTLADVSAQQFLRNSGVVNATLDKPSLKQFLQLAAQWEAINRYFTDLDSGGSMYYEIPTVTLTGDYKKSALVYFTGSVISILGNGLNQNSRLRVMDTGQVQWRPEESSTQVNSTTGAVPLNTLSIIEVERIGSTGTITINGIEVVSTAVPTGGSVTAQIGANNVTYSDGIIANVSITDAGTPTTFYPLNENFGETPVVKNSLAVLGAELVTLSNPPIVLTGPSTVDGLDFRVLTDGSGGASTVGIAMPSGTDTYIVTFGAAMTVGTISITNQQETVEYLNITASGNYAVVVGNVSNTATINLKFKRLFGGLVTDGAISNLTIKQADGYGTAINISKSDYFTEESNGDYLGVEQLSITPDAEFTDNLDGTYSITNATSTQDLVNTPGSVDGLTYRMQYGVTDIPAGTVRSRAGLSVGAVISSPTALQSDDLFSSINSSGGLVFRVLAGTTATIKPESIKQLLEKA